MKPRIPRPYNRMTMAQLTRAGELRAEGMTHAAIGELLGIKGNTIRVALVNEQKRAALRALRLDQERTYAELTEHEQRMVDAKLNEGLTVRTVAEHLGRKWYVISKYVRDRNAARRMLREGNR